MLGMNVAKVTVLEISKDLIDNFGSILSGSSKKLFQDSIENGRLELVQADCHSQLSEDVISKVKGCDYAWIDTWEFLGDFRSLERAIFLQDQIQAKTVDYWGMELEFITMMTRISGTKDNINKKRNAFFDVVRDFPMPITAKKLPPKALAFYFDLVMTAGTIATIQQRQKKSKNRLAIHM